MTKNSEQTDNIESPSDSQVIDFDKLGLEQAPALVTRTPLGLWAKLILFVTVASSLFHLYTGGYRVLPAMQQRPIHLAFILFLTFILYPPTKKKVAHLILWEIDL